MQLFPNILNLGLEKNYRVPHGFMPTRIRSKIIPSPLDAMHATIPFL